MRRRLLLVRSGGIGDVLQLTPSLVSLRAHDPSLEVSCLGPPQVYEVLRQRGLIGEVVPLDHGPWWRAFAPELPLPETLRPWCASFSEVVSFGSPPHPELEEWVRGPVRLHPPFPDPGSTTPVWRWISERLRLSFPALPDADSSSTSLGSVDRSSARTVGLFPGSGAPRKNWPLASFLEFARHLRDHGLRPIVLLGPAEERTCPEEAFRGIAEVRFPADLLELAHALEELALFVGNDTGPTHLAAQLGVPTLALFGPSSNSIWEPFGPRVLVLRGEDGRPWPDVQRVLSAAVSALRSATSLPPAGGREDDRLQRPTEDGTPR